MDRDAAETIALKALAFVAADADALRGMLAASGIEAEALRSRAGEPEVLAGVLDYLLGDEARLRSFCDAAGLEPQAPARARARLPGGDRER